MMILLTLRELGYKGQLAILLYPKIYKIVNDMHKLYVTSFVL